MNPPLNKPFEVFDTVDLLGLNSFSSCTNSQQLQPSERMEGPSLRQRLVEFLATGFYFGKSPVAPGTVGTLVAIPLVYALAPLGPIPYMFATLLLVLFAVVIAQLHENFKGEHDSKEIVIDEIVGYLIAMTWLPLNWISLGLAFVLFRFFDILKPWPIREIDQRVGGGLGVVVDDVAAGIAASLILQVIYVQTNWLGSQWVGS